jgi:hypothetical protein
MLFRAKSSLAKSAGNTMTIAGSRPVILLRECQCVAAPSGPKGTVLNDHILKAIDEEIARLRQARAILAESGSPSPSKKAKKASAVTASKAAPRRTLSAKARRAIAEAQRKRWAKVKSQKKAAAPAAGVRKEPTAS